MRSTPYGVGVGYVLGWFGFANLCHFKLILLPGCCSTPTEPHIARGSWRRSCPQRHSRASRAAELSALCGWRRPDGHMLISRSLLAAALDTSPPHRLTAWSLATKGPRSDDFNQGQASTFRDDQTGRDHDGNRRRRRECGAGALPYKSICRIASLLRVQRHFARNSVSGVLRNLVPTRRARVPRASLNLLRGCDGTERDAVVNWYGADPAQL